MKSRTDVQLRKVADLVPFANNARTHSDEQIAAIMASIKEFGWTNPILIDGENGIVAGHGRLTAATRLGIEEVPTLELDGLTDAQRRAYIIADNRLAESGTGWDTDLLALELGDLQLAGFDIALTGFDAADLADFAGGTDGLTDPDEVPEVPDDPITKPGDLYLLGSHRLLCGDATSADDTGRLFAGAKPHLMVTDPPYGVEYDPAWRTKALKDGAKRAEGDVANDDAADWREAWALFPGDVAYVWHAGNKAQIAAEALEVVGFEIRTQIIWAKNRHVIGRGHYHGQHEPCWYAVKKGKTGHWRGDRKQSTIWDITHQKSETGHSTQKPVEAMRRPIVNNSRAGEAVYDPFLGSGTTMIAAEMEGRHCYGLEISPAYCDVIVKRWEDFTGQKAELEVMAEAAE